MDEYLSEQEQWERVKQWIRQNVIWVAAGIGIAALGVGGWRWWQGQQEQQYLKAGAVYAQIVDAFDKKDVAGVTKYADQLVRDYPRSGYADQAELAAARILLDNTQHAAAIERLRHVLETSKDAELRLVARLRIARIQIDQKKPDEALATLTAAETGAFAPRFAEVRGDALLAKGDREGALKAYREAQAAGSAAVDADLLTLKINDLSSS